MSKIRVLRNGVAVKDFNLNERTQAAEMTKKMIEKCAHCNITVWLVVNGKLKRQLV